MQTLLSASELCRIINHNGGAVLDNTSPEKIDAYLSLKEQLLNTDVSKDMSFQECFLGLYKVRGVRIKNATLERYFELMEAEKENMNLSFRKMCSELFSKVPSGNVRPNHAAFVSQMLNLINDTYPVIDGNMSYIFGFEGPTQSKMTATERILIYAEFYDYVRKAYKEVLNENHLYQLLKVYEIQLKREGRRVEMIKRLDLIVRATGMLDKKGKLILPEYRPSYNMV